MRGLRLSHCYDLVTDICRKIGWFSTRLKLLELAKSNRNVTNKRLSSNLFQQINTTVVGGVFAHKQRKSHAEKARQQRGLTNVMFDYPLKVRHPYHWVCVRLSLFIPFSCLWRAGVQCLPFLLLPHGVRNSHPMHCSLGKVAQMSTPHTAVSLKQRVRPLWLHPSQVPAHKSMSTTMKCDHWAPAPLKTVSLTLWK